MQEYHIQPTRDAYAALDHQALAKLLRAEGFRRARQQPPGFAGKAVIYQRGVGPTWVEIICPARRDLGDYALRMRECVQCLADANGRDEVAMYQRIKWLQEDTAHD